MSPVEQALTIVREVHAKLGTAELARQSGVSYTTLRDCAARDFGGPAVATLNQLAKAAVAWRERQGADVDDSSDQSSVEPVQASTLLRDAAPIIRKESGEFR